MRRGRGVEERRDGSGVLLCFSSPLLLCRRLQYLKNPPRGRDPGDARVEACAQQAQRQIELGGQDQHEQGIAEEHLAVEQTQADLHRDDGGAERADHLQHQRRQECHPQHVQRGVPVLACNLADDGDLLSAAVEQLEGGQALQDVEEVAAHAAERGPLALGQCVGEAADQHHEDRDERGRQHQHRGRERVARGDKCDQGERHDGCERKLRQILAEIGIQRLDAFDCGVDQLAGALAARERGPQGQDARHQACAQRVLHLLRHPVGRHLARPDGQRAHRGQPDQHQQPGPHARQIQPAQKRAIHSPAERESAAHGGRAAQRAQRHRERQAGTRGLRFLKKAAVEETRHRIRL